MKRKDFFRRRGFTDEGDALRENYFYCRRRWRTENYGGKRGE